MENMNNCYIVGGFFVCNDPWASCDYREVGKNEKCRYCLLNTYCTSESAKEERKRELRDGSENVK